MVSIQRSTELGVTTVFGNLWEGITAIGTNIGNAVSAVIENMTQTSSDTRVPAIATEDQIATSVNRHYDNNGRVTGLVSPQLSKSNFPFSLPWRRRKNKQSFLLDLRKGDILISTHIQDSAKALIGQMIGHAAIMATRDWVVEMPGENPGFGSGSSSSASYSSYSSSSLRESKNEGNNRRISKGSWYDAHLSDNIMVYRCPDSAVAEMAANWAYTHYYNSSGGEEKNIHVQYSVVSPVFKVRDPCYCSKLVLQSYYYGTGDKSVLWPTVEVPVTGAIVPTTIPNFFKPAYALSVVGLY